MADRLRNRRIRYFLIALIGSVLLLLANGTPRPASAQFADVIIGPVIAGAPVGGGGIQFYDVGSGREWGLWTPVTTYRFFVGDSEVSWSPDGCNMIVQNPRSRQWMVLSLLDMVVIGLSLDGSVTPMPIWHPDGQYLTVMITDESDGPQVYLLDYETGLMEPLVQFTGPGNPLKWLSSTELLYSSDGYYRVWDMAAQESRPFGSDTYPRYGRPLDFQQFLYFTHLSPDYTAITRFYSVRNYNIGVRLGEFDGLTVDEMAELDAIYRTSGFDIHDLNTGITTHVDLDGDFVETLQWSPSGERILVTANDGTFADAGRIYIYDVESGAVEQAGDFPTLEDTEYGPYLPTWSADEQWLAIPSLEVAGYVRYNLTTGETIPLNTGTAIEYMTAFTGVYTRLAWSPVMSYADSPCANFD